MPTTVIAQAHSNGPAFVVLAEPSDKLNVLNAALEAHLGGSGLTADHFLDIILAGVRALDRETVTAAAVHLDSARSNLFEAAEVVTRTVSAVPESTAHMVGQIVAQATHHLPTNIAEATRAAAVAALDPSVGGTAGSALIAANRAVISEFTEAVAREITTLSTAVHNTRDAVIAGRGADEARAEERVKSSAKGADFEELVSELLSGVCERESLVLRDTSDVIGAVPRSKKGDFVVFDDTRPLIVVEAKNSLTFLRTAQIHTYLDEATRNREVSTAIWAVNGVEQNDGQLVRFLSPTRISVAVTGEDSDETVLRAVLRCALSAARKDTSSSTVSGVRERLTSLTALDTSLRRLVTESDSLVSLSRSVKSTASDVRTALADAVNDLLRILDDGADDADDTVSPFDTAVPARVAELPESGNPES